MDRKLLTQTVAECYDVMENYFTKDLGYSQSEVIGLCNVYSTDISEDYAVLRLNAEIDLDEWYDVEQELNATVEASFPNANAYWEPETSGRFICVIDLEEESDPYVTDEQYDFVELVLNDFESETGQTFEITDVMLGRHESGKNRLYIELTDERGREVLAYVDLTEYADDTAVALYDRFKDVVVDRLKNSLNDIEM